MPILAHYIDIRVLVLPHKQALHPQDISVITILSASRVIISARYQRNLGYISDSKIWINKTGNMGEGVLLNCGPKRFNTFRDEVKKR